MAPVPAKGDDDVLRWGPAHVAGGGMSLQSKLENCYV